MMNISPPICDTTVHGCDKYNIIGNYFVNSYINLNLSSPLIPHRNCDLSVYVKDHDYCEENISFLIVNEINKITISEAMKIEKRTRKTNNLWFVAKPI